MGYTEAEQFDIGTIGLKIKSWDERYILNKIGIGIVIIIKILFLNNFSVKILVFKRNKWNHTFNFLKLIFTSRLKILLNGSSFKVAKYC